MILWRLVKQYSVSPGHDFTILPNHTPSTQHKPPLLNLKSIKVTFINMVDIVTQEVNHTAIT